MIDLIEANWLAFVLALVIGVLVAWWMFGRTSSTSARRHHRPDVLDEGVAPAQRNQSLIDAAPAATLVPAPVSGVMAGVGEIVAVAAQDEVEAAATAANKPAATQAGDDLLKIKGVGPKLQALLATLGVTTYAQIAAMSDADLADLDAKLGTFAGRPKRDSWIEQAKLLAAGDTAGFEGKFGKL